MSNTLTAIAFAVVMMIALIQTLSTFRYGAKWMLVMVIGEYSKHPYDWSHLLDDL
ncbi:hypothetical protein PAXINDRAFT_11981 [Paxillus involutus ATCC 200175]|uniref:Uncharacterized protein n=1 Tax=Paxillus involutus ATCC 200175 TaxID=664439 RepID=A0A0C9U7E6_PAXIN|nr:hypothetical protein PAXINDRAFT_11981 [Paxillus involutus ATCC 200175]